MATMAWEEVRHQVAIAGRVTDAGTGAALPGIAITITDGPAGFKEQAGLWRRVYGEGGRDAGAERPDRTTSAPDGHYHFLDLPNGTYTVAASRPAPTSRYGTVQGTTTVSRTQDRIDWVRLDLSLPPTTLRGHVYVQPEEGAGGGGSGPEPIHMVEIRLLGSGERTFTDTQGGYSLAGVESGRRELTLSARGYRGQRVTVTLGPAGTVKQSDFFMTPGNGGH